MTDALRPFLSRILAALLASGCAYLALHYGVAIDTDTQHQLADAMVGVILPLFLGVYATAHKVIDKKLNPDDAASSHAAVVGKAKQRQRKQTRALEKRLGEAGLRTKKPEVPSPMPPDSELADVPPQLPMPQRSAFRPADDPHNLD